MSTAVSSAGCLTVTASPHKASKYQGSSDIQPHPHFKAAAVCRLLAAVPALPPPPAPPPSNPTTPADRLVARDRQPLPIHNAIPGAAISPIGAAGLGRARTPGSRPAARPAELRGPGAAIRRSGRLGGPAVHRPGHLPGAPPPAAPQLPPGTTPTMRIRLAPSALKLISRTCIALCRRMPPPAWQRSWRTGASREMPTA